MKIFLGIILLFITAQSLAATWTNGNQELNNLIWMPGMEGFYVKPSTYHDPEGCGGTANVYLVHETLGEKEKDRLLSLVMLAYSTGNKVHIWVDGCQGSIPKFTGLQINK